MLEELLILCIYSALLTLLPQLCVSCQAAMLKLKYFGLDVSERCWIGHYAVNALRTGKQCSASVAPYMTEVSVFLLQCCNFQVLFLVVNHISIDIIIAV
jgi:hypothetical protein